MSYVGMHMNSFFANIVLMNFVSYFFTLAVYNDAIHVPLEIGGLYWIIP